MVGRWPSLPAGIRGSTIADILGKSASCFGARRGTHVIGAGILQPRGVWCSVGRRPASRIPTSAPDHPLGISVGAIGWPVGSPGGFGSGGRPGWVAGCGPPPDLGNILITPSGVGCD